jgi:hypothetical protein
MHVRKSRPHLLLGGRAALVRLDPRLPQLLRLPRERCRDRLASGGMMCRRDASIEMIRETDSVDWGRECYHHQAILLKSSMRQVNCVACINGCAGLWPLAPASVGGFCFFSGESACGLGRHRSPEL